MLFSSNVFLFAYLPIVLLMYYLCPFKFRNIVLLLVSLFFYGWGEPVYLILMIVVILINYLCGMLIHKVYQCGNNPQKVLVWGVAANLLILGFFKYFSFFVTQLQNVFSILENYDIPQIPLPIGISFYVFQSMSYIIDVYRKEVPVQKSVLTFGTYVTLFPQLIAGPIVRYQDVAVQMESRRENLSDFSSGVMLFVIGLSKKILLANPMGSLWNALQLQQGMICAWVGLVAYTLQIYFDFSGYSDMARGLGRMFGFEFLENFNYPYISRSVTEFWRRWHISLSTWFREYVYIPLGGNRHGTARQICNLLIVWALTGFWHGASWNYVLWGIYYAVLLIVEKIYFLKQLKKMPAIIGNIYTLLVILVGWAMFYFEDLSDLSFFFVRLTTPIPCLSSGVALVCSYLPLIVVACFAATPFASRYFSTHREKITIRIFCIVGTAVLLLLCTAALARQSYNPFIYFRF